MSRLNAKAAASRRLDFEAAMPINMGQCLSIPFIVMGIYFVVRAWRRSNLNIMKPNTGYK